MNYAYENLLDVLKLIKSNRLSSYQVNLLGVLTEEHVNELSRVVVDEVKWFLSLPTEYDSAYLNAVVVGEKLGEKKKCKNC